MGTFSLLACRPEAETLSQMACGGDPISPPQLLVLPTLAPGPVSPGLWCQGRAGDSVGGGVLAPFSVWLPLPHPKGCSWAQALGCEGPLLQRGVKRPPSLPPPPILEGCCLSGKLGGRHRW